MILWANWIIKAGSFFPNGQVVAVCHERKDGKATYIVYPRHLQKCFLGLSEPVKKE